VIDTTDKAHLLERIRRVLLRGDPRDEHLGPGGDAAGGVSGAGIERLLKDSRPKGCPPQDTEPDARAEGTSPDESLRPPFFSEFTPGEDR
jgi:hypothetical protein